MPNKCKTPKGDVFEKRSQANKFRKGLIKQGFSKVPKIKKVKGCVSFTNIPKTYYKV